MKLMRGVTGFLDCESECKSVLSFKKICYSAVRQVGGEIDSFSTEDGAMRNFEYCKVVIRGEVLYVLVNSQYPYVAFAKTVEPFCIEFCNCQALKGALEKYYTVIDIEILNQCEAPFLETEGVNAMDEVELEAIRFWQPGCVGFVVFNFWD
ncbi:MAG: hypothetical protein ACRCWQ_09490 [Bacilli bacterium]